MAQETRAVRFHDYGGSEKLALETVPRPEPKTGEVLVQVHFAGVNPIDWKFRAGYLKDYMPIGLPFTPGQDVSGTVAELGPGVKGLTKGQAVFGIAKGGYAEYAIAAAADLVVKPDKVSFETAATIPTGALTAWKAVEDAGVKSGQSVVVQGAAGGVGQFVVQFARLKGAKVIGVASADNAAFVKSLGAEQTVDYKKGLAESGIKDVDAVIDLVGGEALEKSYSLVKKGGTLVTVAGQVSEDKAKARGIKALGSGRGPTEQLKQIADLLAKGSLRAEVGQVFPLAKAAAAQDLSQTGHGKGRILLKTL